MTVTIREACAVFRERCINAVGGDPDDLTLTNLQAVNQRLVLVGLDLDPGELDDVAMERAVASTNAVTVGLAGPVQAFATAWADGLLTGRIMGAMANEAAPVTTARVPDALPDPEAPPTVNPAVALHPPTLEACRQAVLRTLDAHLGNVPRWSAATLAARRDAAWAATDAVMEELVRRGRP